MENTILLDKISKLPDSLKLEVYNFVNSLLNEYAASNGESNKPVFGSGRGMFNIKPGFDEPLEDFKDYM